MYQNHTHIYSRLLLQIKVSNNDHHHHTVYDVFLTQDPHVFLFILTIFFPFTLSTFGSIIN